MMPFVKYHGAGNDFILIDQRREQFLTAEHQGPVGRLCRRRFGIGADGLILLQEKSGYDFEMIYFNADGKEGTLCGNGGRCLAAFARRLGIVTDRCRFWAIDGEHEALIEPGGEWVDLKMADVPRLDFDQNACIVNTGSPHYVVVRNGLDALDVAAEGRAIRFQERYRAVGINVNFIEDLGDALRIRTYERGVEDETLACGTGVTAAALAHHHQNRRPPGSYETTVHALGGTLKVRFTADAAGHFSNIWLCGPVKFVFEGIIEPA